MVLTFTSKERWEDNQHPHESPLLMWLPMAILAIGSVTTGFLFTRGHALVNWLSPVVGEHAEGEKVLLQPMVVSGLALFAVLIGVGIAIAKYQLSDVDSVAPQSVSIFTKIARKDLMQDSFNEAVFMRPGQALTNLLVQGDEKVIDGAVRGVAATALGAGSTFRRTQTGFARSYAALILIGAITLIAAIWVVTQ
jgi:NADH-quinone oxidoreductase subunit L